MKGRISNPQGDVMIRTDVIAKYAGSMAVECFGIVGMASVSMKDGLVHLLKKDSITRASTYHWKIMSLRLISMLSFPME